jgi:hypothetical protein
MSEAHDSTDLRKNELAEGLNAMFSAILGQRNERGEARLAACDKDPAIVKSIEALKQYDLTRFELSYIYPAEELGEAIVGRALSNNPKISFLVLHSSFVGSHLQNLFESLEGRAYCADKEGTVIRSLIGFFHKGTRIEFNYDQEYTYFLPRKILRDHDSILAYFDSLMDLYYGRPNRYLKQMALLAAAASMD